MVFFKELKGESANKDAESNEQDSMKPESAEPKNEDETTSANEDYLDEDMYKQILATAEQILTEDGATEQDENNKNEENESVRKEHKKSKKPEEIEIMQKQEEQTEDTMVDYDENAVDSEILDTLLNEDDKTEETPSEENSSKEKTETGMHAPNPELAEEDKGAVTVITKGTTINGSIISDCSLDVMGTINGDIECLGKLSISGKVIGNSMASEVYVSTERLEGCINSEGSVKIGLGTVVIGDITASSGVIAGAVKGEVDINGPVVIDSTAIIKGNIKAKSVQMNNGAVLEGFCSLSYAEVDINDIFE